MSAFRSWRTIGGVSETGLREARLQLHHLVQLIPEFAQRFVEPDPDDRHRSMVWDPRLRGFRSRGATRAPDLFVVVRPEPLEVQLWYGGDVQRYGAPGRSVLQARAWLERGLQDVMGTGEVALRSTEYEIPDHPVGTSASFDADPTALEQLVRLFDDALIVVAEVARRSGFEASPVTVWPHHFDLASLLTLPDGTSDGEERTIGVGMTPGDEGYPDPYFYVTPHPYPWEASRPRLTHGHWHVDGYLAAILPWEVWHSGGRGAQDSCVRAFLSEAVERSTELVTGR